MSAKSNMTNSIRSGTGSLKQNSLHEKLHFTTSNEEKVMLAAEESKDRLYEPKRDKKMVRVLTVVVYVFSVSLAAIMLSLYYVFFWEPKGPHYVKPKVSFSTSNLNSTGAGASLTPPLPRCLPFSEPSHPAISTTATSVPEAETAPYLDYNISTTANSTEDYTQPNTYEDVDNNSIVASDEVTVAIKKKRRREDPV